MKPLCRRSGGQAAFEFLLVTVVLVLALGLGQQGAIGRLVRALSDYYARFTHTLGLP